MKNTLIALTVLGLVGLVGCSERPSVFPNSDPALRRFSTQFAADAAVRFPYKAPAPQAGNLTGKGEVDYMLKTVQIANLSDENWSNCEVWINESFVVFVPVIESGKDGGKVKTLNFAMFFDGSGNYYQSNDLKSRITKLEILKDGKMFGVPIKLAD